MTEFQKKKLTHFFKILDFNKTGSLEVEDFAELSENIRQTFNFEDGGKEHKRIVTKSTRFFHHLLEQMNLSSMSINLADWLNFTDQVILQSNDEDEQDEFVEEFIRFFFDLFDSNNDGFISIDEYKQLFEIYKIDQEDVDYSFSKVDRNGDFRLSRYELLFAGRVFFTSDDESLRGNHIFGELVA